MGLKNFFKYDTKIKKGVFKTFYSALFITTLIPYAPSVLPFLPAQILGFNWSGIGWVMMLLVSTTLFLKTDKSHFPLRIWFPWAFCISTYIVLDFTFQGLQLTLQYLLPLIVGVIAGTFQYTQQKLIWLFQNQIKTTAVLYVIFLLFKITFGYTPHMAATPMYFAFVGTVSLGIYYSFKVKLNLILYGLLFLMPLLSVTRMAILVFITLYVVHFANSKISHKIVVGFFGFLAILLVVNMPAFQEKTFYNGKGNISDISVNYYDDNNSNFNNSGRSSWRNALDKGLKESPIIGNGPRSDASVLGNAVGLDVGEAHNDYLSIRYNYGWVGLIALLLGFFLSFIKLLKMSRKLKKSILKTLIQSSMTLFVGLLMFMYSDNIMKYSTWFTNYFFALMGICFSLYYSRIVTSKTVKNEN